MSRPSVKLLQFFPLLLLLTLTLTILKADSVFAAAGDLDLSFGNNGLATVNNVATFDNVVVQSDGKLVAVGRGGCGPAFCGSSAPFLVRFNSNGGLDTSFGAGGIVSIADYDIRLSMPLALQSGDKLLTSVPFLSRYSSSGTFETAFDSAPLNGQANHASIALQPDGKILFSLAGILQRYNPDGTHDPGFGSDGVVTTFRPYESVSVQNDGSIDGVACDAGDGAFVSRHLEDGSLDLGFGSGGTVFISNTGGRCSINSQSDGKLVLVSNGGTSNTPQIELRRLHPDGSLDASFGTAGVATAAGTANSSTLQPDGKILAVGNTFTANGTPNAILTTRFNADGSPDVTFGTSGTVLTGASQNYAAGYGLALQPDGKIIVAGVQFDIATQVGGATLARYDSPEVMATALGSNVTLPFVRGVTLTFASVVNGGATSVSTAATGPTPPGGFQLGNGGLYYDIQTTATYTTPLTECFKYDASTFPDPNLAQLFHYENGSWVDVTTSNDTANLVICGTTTSLSPFAIFAKADPAALIHQLIGQVQNLHIKSGTIQSLTGKLEAAQKILAASKSNNNVPACNQLESFGHEVQAQSGKSLPAAQANALLANAQQVESLLACSKLQ